MELNPASAPFYQQQDGMAFSGGFQQDPLSLLLGQDAATSGAGMNGLLPMNGLPSMTAGMVEQPHYTDALCMPGGNGYDSMAMEAEEPGPLPCLPRPGRMAGGYGNSAALLMQQQQQLQQLQRCGYPNSGAPGPGPGSRAMRPRRHSVTIGMLNEHQQQQAFLAAGGQLPAGWLGSSAGGPAGGGPPAGAAAPQRMQMLPQQSSPNKQLQELNMQAAAAASQLGMGKAALGQPFMAGAGGPAGPMQLPPQLAGQAGQGGPALSGAAGLGGMNGPLAGSMDLPPAYGMNAPRMPGAGGSRRHSWAPMGADSSMAYARSWLMQQQQQASGSLTAQLGDAGALFVNQQQQDQLGLGRLGAQMVPRNGLDSTGASAYGSRAAGLMQGGPDAANADHAGGFAGLHAQGALTMSMGQPASAVQMYGAEALAKEQLAQHLQQQLQQLQLQDLASRMGGPGQGLDPYAEPFVSQASLMQQAGGLAGGLAGMDPYATALQQELQQQQQSALALQLVEEAGLSPGAAAAAASMYAPLQVNGVSVDTQLLVSPYVDNWDVLAQGSAAGSMSGSVSVPSSSGMSALAGVGMAAPLGQMGLGGKQAKAMPMNSLSSSSGIGSNRLNHNSSVTSMNSSTPTGSSSGSKGSSAAPAAAAVAAATMLASLPPISKVCSEAPWNLKKAADEDAKVMAAQQAQVHKLTVALEHSKTLQRVHAAETAAAEAAAAVAAAAARSNGDASCSGDGSAALFGYKLPDSGDDTWGGSSGGGEAAVVPGGNCISQEPSNKLFVGNIGWWVTEEDLLHWFSRFGTVINVKVSV